MNNHIDRPWGWWITPNEAQVMTSNNFARTYEAGAVVFSGSRSGRKRKSKPKIMQNLNVINSL